MTKSRQTQTLLADPDSASLAHQATRRLRGGLDVERLSYATEANERHRRSALVLSGRFSSPAADSPAQPIITENRVRPRLWPHVRGPVAISSQARSGQHRNSS